ncbi:MAG: TonB-dependent receptor [Bacteroidales bacterium]|nr:TonB-dependent receptor [Bacteroidales bacterium]
MKKILIWMMLLMPMAMIAQNSIKGAVTDERTGEAIPFCTVVLKDTKYYTSTDINGLYILAKIPDGEYTLVIRYVGYNEIEKKVTLSKGYAVQVNARLSPSVETLKDVVVTGNRIEERKVETAVSVEKITASQIQQMPSIGGTSDIAQYMQVLPGVNSTGDQGGQLYIRGGSMIQNLCLLDGMIVYNPFHSIGLYSIFETDVILNANIYTGGFGAEYGGRLSSVMDISTRDGNKRRHTGKVGLNTFGANVILEGPLKKETADNPSAITYLVMAKNSYLSHSSKLFYPYIDGGLPYDFLDIYGKISLNSGSGSKLSLFGFRFDDQVLGFHSIADYHWNNYGAGGNFALVTGTASVIDGTIAFSNYSIALEDLSNKPKSSQIGGFNANINVTNFYGNNNLKVGISMEGYATKYQYTNQYGIPLQQDENTSNISLYATYHMNKGKWLFDPGVRFIYYASLNDPQLEPRLSAKWIATDNLRVKLAAGFYSQILLDARSDNDIVNLFNGFLTGSSMLNLPSLYLDEEITSCVQKAQHLVAGVEYDFTPHLMGNAEVYLKNFGQLLNMNPHQLYDRGDPAYNSGGVFEKPQYYLTDFVIEKGVATGFDLSLCYDVERLYVWATYSLGYVQRTDEVQTYNPHYDRRHTVNLLATYSIGDHKEWELSGRWSFGSGYPFTRTAGVYEDLNIGGTLSGNYTNENGQMGIYYDELYGGRLPVYHRLDLSAKRRFSIGSRSILDLNISATNVYNRNNLFYYDRLTSHRVDQLPLLVSLGVSVSF